AAAIAPPTFTAAARSPPLFSSPFRTRRSEEAEASVWPAASSMIWQEMWPRLRWTASRGRSVVPKTLRRTRSARRRSIWDFSFIRSMRDLRLVGGPARPRGDLPEGTSAGRSAHEGLPGLPLDHLAEVPDALALVGLGRPDFADLRGELPDDLLVAGLEH